MEGLTRSLYDNPKHAPSLMFHQKMLHELLLELSGLGQPSLLSPEDKSRDDPVWLALSPPERTLFQSLASLGTLHASIRADAARISATHASIVCRAVSTATVSTHLANFQQRIVDVEQGILREDPKLVGAYDIVPLSALVGEFDGWDRRLQYLADIIHYISGDELREVHSIKANRNVTTGSQVIDKLRNEARSGYPDIHKIAAHLGQVAETAWLRQLSSFLLFGRLPAFGAADFFVTSKVDSDGAHGTSMFRIKSGLVPSFAAPSANSILFVGKSLDYIRDRCTTNPRDLTDSSSLLESTLLSAHLALLSSLEFPISPPTFTRAINSIRLSLSRNILQHLLPLSSVFQILRILKDFFLLECGEFAIALVSAADDRLTAKHQRQADSSKRKGFESLSHVIVKEGEVAGVLARTWATISYLQDHDDRDDEGDLDLSRELISLSIRSIDSTAPVKASHFLDPDETRLRSLRTSFDDLLLPTTTALTMRIPSPLDLFLSPTDASVYSDIHAYLLSIRRGHLHLSGLWKLTRLRRVHLSSKSPANMSHHNASTKVSSRRTWGKERALLTRPIWATIGCAVFFLGEIGQYFQGEAVKSSWDTFQAWLDPEYHGQEVPIEEIPRRARKRCNHAENKAITPSKGNPSSYPQAANEAQAIPHDPESLTTAHQSYLASLIYLLLLDEQTFTKSLKAFLVRIDHLCGLMKRIETVQQNLDTQSDTGVEDTFTNLHVEEQDVMKSLEEARLKLYEDMVALIGHLRNIDDARASGTGLESNHSFQGDRLVPWKGPGLDRLLMKLDSIGGQREDFDCGDR